MNTNTNTNTNTNIKTNTKLTDILNAKIKRAKYIYVYHNEREFESRLLVLKPNFSFTGYEKINVFNIDGNTRFFRELLETIFDVYQNLHNHPDTGDRYDYLTIYEKHERPSPNILDIDVSSYYQIDFESDDASNEEIDFDSNVANKLKLIELSSIPFVSLDNWISMTGVLEDAFSKEKWVYHHKLIEFKYSGYTITHENYLFIVHINGVELRVITLMDAIHLIDSLSSPFHYSRIKF